MTKDEIIKLKFKNILEKKILSFINKQNSKIIKKFTLNLTDLKIELNKILKSDYNAGVSILKDVYTQLYKEFGTWQYENITGDAEWFINLNIEIIRQINKQAEESFKYINAGTFKNWEKFAQRAIDKGLTINEAKNEITKIIPGISKKKALRIARTEIICQSNKISLNTAMQVKGKLLKYWIYTHDTRTRKTHKKAGVDYSKKKAIALDENFKIGKAKLKHPADRDSSHKEEIFNCRCTLGYVKKEEK